jgi:hypothetical protein
MAEGKRRTVAVRLSEQELRNIKRIALDLNTSSIDIMTEAIRYMTADKEAISYLRNHLIDKKIINPT